MKNKVAQTDEKSFLAQVDSEYTLAYGFIQPRWTEWQTRLKMYNNQIRSKNKIGSRTMFIFHQTLLASLYSDKLEVTFLPREDGDEPFCDNLNDAAKFDYEEMRKAQLDYEWDWDTTFYGVGVCLMQGWDAKMKCPIPEIVDPMVSLRDPTGQSFEGNRNGAGKIGYFGRWIYLPEHELKARIKNGTYNMIDSCDEVKDGESSDNQVEENKRIRMQSMGYQNQFDQYNLTGASKIYKLLEWWNFDEDGSPVFSTLGNDRTLVLNKKVLKGKCLPLIERKLNPNAHVYDGNSVTDLTEDIQRQNAIMLNLSLDMEKAGLYPRYLVDQNKIKNKAELADYSFDQYIFIDGSPADAVVEVPRQHTTSNASYIMGEMDNIAQRATATPDIQQGVQAKSNRTASENAMIQENVDTRYGLAAKIFGWSEQRFWQMWYQMYKENFSSVDKKVVRIVGEAGMKWRPLTKENLDLGTDPDVRIESAEVARKERIEKQKALSNIVQLTMQDPTVNRNYILRKMAKVEGLNPEEIEHIFQKTADEYVATRENAELNENKLVQIHPEDDDYMHIEIHEQAADTAAKRAHIQTHQKSLFEKKTRPQLQASSAPPTPPVNAMGMMGNDAPSQPRMTFGQTPNLANQPAQ